MLSIRALICSPDCGIKIDMRDRSIWQREPRFLRGPSTVMPVEELQRRSTPSKAAASRRTVEEISQPAWPCIFYILYLCNIYQREISSLPARSGHCIDPS